MPAGMRHLPLLIALLAGAVGIGLGLRVMWGSSSGTAIDGGGGDGGRSGAQAARGVYSGGAPQGHVYTGVAWEPADVNPFTTNDPLALRLVLPYTHDGLLDVDPATGALRGALAERWEVAADGASCTFTLRAGVPFADGTPLTMADVLFGWELAKAGHTALGIVGDAFSRVRDVEVVDDRTLRVVFAGTHFAAVRTVGENWRVAQKRFFVDAVAKLAGGDVPAVDSARFAALLHQIKTESGPGTGPYVLHNDPVGLSHWRVRDQMLLVRNEHCWRRAAAPGTWNFAGIRTLFRDEAGATNAFLRGEVDWFLSPKAAELVQSRPELQRQYRRLVYDYETLGIYRVIWNCRRPPLDDPRVRRALGMLFDVDAILEQFEGRGARALAHCPRGSPAYPSGIEPLPYDPPAARRLLREAGFDPEQERPLRIALLAPQATAPLRRITERFVDAARRAGVELEVRDPGPSLTAAKKLHWDGLLGLTSFRASGDPFDFLHSEGADNDGGWSNPEADQLLAAARSDLDPEHRAATWRQLHTLVYREQPVTLLAHPVATIMLHNRIKDLEPGPRGLVPERAWVAPEDQRP